MNCVGNEYNKSEECKNCPVRQSCKVKYKLNKKKIEKENKVKKDISFETNPEILIEFHKAVKDIKNKKQKLTARRTVRRMKMYGICTEKLVTKWLKKYYGL